jgi:hypothetical protein
MLNFFGEEHGRFASWKSNQNLFRELWKNAPNLASFLKLEGSSELSLHGCVPTLKPKQPGLHLCCSGECWPYQLFRERSPVFQDCEPHTWEAELTNHVMWYTHTTRTACTKQLAPVSSQELELHKPDGWQWPLPQACPLQRSVPGEHNVCLVQARAWPLSTSPHACNRPRPTRQAAPHSRQHNPGLPRIALSCTNLCSQP